MADHWTRIGSKFKTLALYLMRRGAIRPKVSQNCAGAFCRRGFLRLLRRSDSVVGYDAAKLFNCAEEPDGITQKSKEISTTVEHEVN